MATKATRVIPDAILTAAPQSVKKLSPPARMQLRSAQNRATVLEEAHKLGSRLQHDAFVRAAKNASQTVQELENNDSVATRLGPEAASYLQTLKENALALQYQQANEYAAIVAEWMRDTWETVMEMPAASFATPTVSERLDAFLRNTSAELELRPGAPALSLGQQLRQFFLGDVISRIAADYDQHEMTARSERLQDTRRQQLAAIDNQVLLDRIAELEAGLVDRAPALLPGERSEIVEDLNSQLETLLRQRDGSLDDSEESEPIGLRRLARAR